jgi:hypothetical protein
MDGEGANRWLIALAIVALGVGIAGLLIGISAKNSSKSDQEFATSVQDQVQSQVPALKAKIAGEASKQAGLTKEEARKARKAGVVTQDDIDSLNKQVAALQKKVNSQGTTQKELQTDVANLQQDVKQLQKQVARLERASG